MFRTSTPRDGGFHAVVSDLPAGFGAVALGEDRLVVGPTGAFVVGDAADDTRAVAERLRRRAERCRAALAAHLPFTPFVDVFVVTERSGDTSPLASVVPARMLHDSLVDGPRILTDEAVERIRTVMLAVATEVGAAA
jgi:hypothetical protein